ncbi:hypothetical protein Cgig2_007500 [Carnegiea gigantea]|uniref:PHD finger protein n=1 Tax=Carnegiea gigantea TaxID=171969 RepID=A0A9Q1JV80_9CARY|nr:hypothetical protein Cgig2_007500 [Carnegiea gigantea]
MESGAMRRAPALSLLNIHLTGAHATGETAECFTEEMRCREGQGRQRVDRQNIHTSPFFPPFLVLFFHESDGGATAMEVEVEVEVGDKVKKRKRENGEEEVKRVAEIVLVLSAMARMRGGKDPTAVEKAMMAEARAKVVALCEELAPKDILPRESFGVLIDDLGLNRLKEQRLGFRTPKLSISDKMALTKRRMEESKTFVAQPASYQSQRLQNTGVASDNCAAAPIVRMVSCDKAGHIPVSAGNVQPTPAVHVSSVASTASAFRPPGAEVPAAVVSSSMLANIPRESTPMVPPKIDRAHLKPDGRLNGPPFVPHIPGARVKALWSQVWLVVHLSSSPDQRVVRTSPVLLQPQSGPWVNIETQKKLPDHLPGRTDGNAKLSAPQMTAQATAGQTPKPVVSHTAPGSKPSVHHQHSMQGMHFAHASPVFPHHLEISKVVQKLLDPKLAQRPVWTPPSRDYMNRAVSCQFCKLIINGVENVLVCDACEKGFHVGCLQSYNAKGIPRGEWHCPRCLAMNRGKPFPPKYGRVTRNMNASKGPPNSAGIQFSSDKKSQTADDKVNQPNAITNGKAEVKTEPQAVKVAESSCESNLQHGNEINEKDMFTATKKDGMPNLVKSPTETKVAAVEASLATSTGSSGDKVCKQSVNSGISPSEEGLISQMESRGPSISGMVSTSDVLPTSSNESDVHQERLSNGAEAPVHQHGECNGVSGCHDHCDGDRHEKDVGKENFLKKERAHNQCSMLAEASESNQHNAYWIGDIARLVDEKNVSQQSVYLTASKISLLIQGMWEECRTGSKWLIVHKCYFPDDLPKEVGRPGAPQSNEVYESTHDSNVMATVIQGLCEVLPFRKFGEETDRRNQGPHTNDRTGPVFIRKYILFI